ncbi:T9SS type A sorting domain-containing protein [Carboxylicivirga sp. A043]|uniref:T9SS type A sorting domain-containing protein n=1 Tax=Carboxylicivirga litoralis TaxID=2816963 RepID=UPI0021CB5178|nr:T9SS type A sorting domain-containing protein [Carboxylicivirga sp. A043]MCU4155057.1 T9SS type A sorting domain-containing protein [Carboxylicivirga sp. A043]
MKKNYLIILLCVISSWAMGQTVEIVEDTHSGTESTSPNNIVTDGTNLYYQGAVNNFTYWYARNAFQTWLLTGTDYELYVYDGINSPVAEIYNTNVDLDETDAKSNVYDHHYGAGVNYSFVMNGQVYFSADKVADASTAAIFQICTYDEGTITDVADIELSMTPIVNNNVAYFVGSDNKLYSWDGSSRDATLLLNQDGWEIANNDFIPFGTDQFIAYAQATGETERNLMIYDATNGAVLLKDFITGGSDNISSFIKVGEKVVFKTHITLAEPDEYGNTAKYAFAITNGTTEGTTEISLLNDILVDGPTPLFSDGNTLYCSARVTENSSDINVQLIAYTNDGSEELTILSKEQDNTGAASAHSPSDMVKYTDGWIYYAGYRYVGETRTAGIFRTNGSVIELVNNTVSSPSKLTVFNDKIYFSGQTDSYGTELFVLDPKGTATSIERAINNSITVSPNPSYGYVNVAGVEPGTAYEIYSIAGAMVEKGIVSNNQIDYNVQPGVYLLKVGTKVTKIMVK